MVGVGAAVVGFEFEKGFLFDEKGILFDEKDILFELKGLAVSA